MSLITGDENYDNQVKYGQEVFHQLHEIQQNGFHFEGVLHAIKVICCCDWKAGACIEGK